METQVLIPLDQIDHNPYQPRHTEDSAAVAEIADSIARNGLLQPPTARRVNGRVQLAFGHTRLAAHHMLQAEYMPLFLRELTDLQMFEIGVAENIKRRDLNPIEQAAAMKRYMDEFGKTSVEAAEFFGVSPESVRGTVRYLNLPEPVQEKLAAGEINQTAARKLMTIARVDQAQVKQAMDNITSGMSAEDAVDTAMRDSDKAFIMWFGWRGGKPLAGDNLWAIDLAPAKFPMKQLPEMKVGDALKSLDIQEGFMLDRVKLWIDCLTTGICKGPDGIREVPEPGDTVAEHLIKHGAPADVIEKLVHLLQPPACSSCPFHSVSDKQHFCGFKPCHTRKRKAWSAAEAEKLSKKLGIAIYDPLKDGKTIVPMDGAYGHAGPTANKLVQDKHPDLRLQPHRNDYSEHCWTNSNHVRVILVGNGAKSKKEQEQKAKAAESSRDNDRDRQWRLQNQRRDASQKFQDEIANPIFAVAFKEMTNLFVMAALVGAVPPKKADKKTDVLKALRIRLADNALDHVIGWDKRQEGPVVVAKHLKGVATTWGVKLPDDFLDTAKGFEPVTAETPKKNGRVKA
jgi:ParB-like partition proteins